MREDLEQIKDLFPNNQSETKVIFFKTDNQAKILITKTSFDYQASENFSLEKEFYDIRVRDAHYRNQPIKVIKEDFNGIIRQVGFCVEKDFPIEVIKIPK